MALIKCPECGKEISDRANVCPNCGCPQVHFSSQTDREIYEHGMKSCPACGTLLDINDRVCFSCGTRLK